MNAFVTSNTLTTGSWNHVLVQSNASNVYMAINGNFTTLTAQGFTPTAGNTTVAPTIAPSTSNTASSELSYPVTAGQFNSLTGPNVAVAKARLIYGANVYSTGSFTPNPNFATSATAPFWSLDSQYPLPTFPSIQDVTPLALQSGSYGAVPTPVGGVTSNVLSPYSTTYPQLDSIRFDGTGYIDYGNAASSSLTTNIWASNWTIEAWVYPTVAAGNVFARSNLATGVDLSLSLSGGTVNFSWGSSSLTGPAISLNQWTHIAATYDGTRANVYAGGTGTSTGTLGSLPFTPSYGVQVGGPTLFTGNLADLRVSNVARYTGSTYTVPTAPFATDSSTLLLLKSLAGQTGTTLQVQGRGLNAVSMGATRSVQSYPPAPMSSYLLDTTSNSSVTYGQGKYVASASTEADTTGTYSAWKAFDKSSSTIWASTYTASDYGTSGFYLGSISTVDVLGNAYLGQWNQLQLPVSVLIQSYSITPYAAGYTYLSPINWVILGSRDGVSWSLVDSRVGYTWASASTVTFSVGATQAYTFWRFITLKTNSSSNYNWASFSEWTLNGTEESLCITSDSKVGVGIANPQRSLEVAGDLVVGGTVSCGNPVGFRNRIINGDFRIDQRNAGASFIVTTAAGLTYTLDRWFGWTVLGSKFSVQQTSVVPLGLGFKNSVLVTSLSGVAALTGYYYGFGQYIEGYNIADLNWGTSYGTPVTVSFWVRSSIAGNYCLALEGTTSFQPSYVAPYTINNPNTWQQIVLTIPPPPSGYTANFSTTNGAGVRLWWDLGSSDVTYGTAAGVWVAADKLRVPGTTSLLATYGATMYLTGVQVERGTVATPFEVRNFSQELALCQTWNNMSAVTGSTSLCLNTAGGNVGIGTTDPKGTFNVLSGNAGFPDTTGSGSSNVAARIQSGSICLDFGSIGGTNPFWIQNHLNTNNATNYPLLLNPNGGNVGIGTTNPSSYTLQVSGTIGATGDITAFFSDDRLKTKTGRLESALEKVLSLEAFTYVPNDLAKSFGFEDSKQRVGLSAQSVQRVLPEAVCPAPFDAENQSGQGYLTVQYDKLVPLLVEALKEERKAREALEERVKLLEQR
jgi:hypothetical protein